MIETKRERAIKILSQVREIYSHLDIIDDELELAISDMQKMDKVERIVEEMRDEDSYYNNSVRFAEKIEQIVKE